MEDTVASAVEVEDKDEEKVHIAGNDRIADDVNNYYNTIFKGTDESDDDIYGVSDREDVEAEGRNNNNKSSANDEDIP